MVGKLEDEFGFSGSRWAATGDRSPSMSSVPTTKRKIIIPIGAAELASTGPDMFKEV